MRRSPSSTRARLPPATAPFGGDDLGRFAAAAGFRPPGSAGAGAAPSGMAPPPRPALLLLCLLLLASGAALLGGGLAATAPMPSFAADPRPADLDVARRFCAAADGAARTGDAAALDRLLAPGFVDHAPSPDGRGGREALTAALLGRRVAFPGLRLVVDDAQATGRDQVTVRLHAEGTAGGAFLGLPWPAAFGAWGPIEVLRIADGLVAERWRGGEDPALPTPLWTARYAPADPRARLTLAVARRSFAPGARESIGVGVGPRFIYVEDGALTASVVLPTTPDDVSLRPHRPPAPAPVLLTRGAARPDPTPRPIAARGPVDLGAGDLLALPAGADLQVVVLGTATADVLLTGVEPVAARAQDWPGAPPPGAAFPADAVLAAGRLALAAGASLALPPGPDAVAVVVEAGRLELGAGDRRGGSALGPGDGTPLAGGTASVWRAAEDAPVTLLVVTVAGAH